MPPTTLPDAAAKSALAELTKEIEQKRTELREIEVLLRQTNGEIQHQSQKQGEASARLRQVENNFDSYAREDIRQAYGLERETQIKLVMVKSQLEQFQNKQRNLDGYIQQLRRLSNLVEQVLASVQSQAVSSAGEGHSQAAHDAVIQTIEAQEAERQRLAQQMHDGPAQSLTNLILQAEIVERLFQNDPERARAEIAGLKSSASTTFQRVREFIFGLRPMMLDDLGLVPTLRRYTQTFENKHSIPVTLNINGDRGLPPYVEVTVFRSVQELMSNVGTHAHASRAQVNVNLENEPLTIDVEDDGTGFEVSDVLARARAKGASGLSTLEKRVEMLGGKLTFQSATGQGTKVHVLIPSA